MIQLLDIIQNNQLKSTYLNIIIKFRGEKYIDIPYSVKGMDMSYSGILTYIEDIVQANPLIAL